jgi:hypothetical protein
MDRDLARASRCNGYVGIVIREPGRNVRLQAANGRCTRCPYRMSWIVIKGERTERPRSSLASRLNSI